jgi:small subunit ribosomal protein S17
MAESDQSVPESAAAEAGVAPPAGEAAGTAEAPEATAEASTPGTTAGVSVTTAAAPADGARPNRRKVREGTVVSDAMQSTVVVAVVERVRHRRYGKTVQRTKRLYVHDAEGTAKVGDRVRVVETRPLSKLKRWRLAEIMERAR